jgi:GTP-binding protein HflX
VAISSRQNTGDEWTPEASLDELEQLAGTAGAVTVGRISQRLPAPSKAFYVGTGKLEELVALQAATPYDVVIADDELTPLQQNNLEERLKVKIIDRVALILDIFAARAHTREGRLQVELAQQIYRYPRLAGQWQHLERLGGGIGTRGPGESQLETDRRLVREKIHRLEEQIEAVRRHRDLYRQRRKRSAIPVVAIVGYTNAGKSTLFNALSQADVLVEDKVFATLDPTTRRVRLPTGGSMLLTDTVGFIRKLPPTIVKAFRATLEELSEASALVHVVDISSSYALQQSRVVEETLQELDLANKTRITVLNKIDLLLPSGSPASESEAARLTSEATTAVGASKDTVLVSAVRKWGIDRLLSTIGEKLGANWLPSAYGPQNGPSQP